MATPMTEQQRAEWIRSERKGTGKQVGNYMYSIEFQDANAHLDEEFQHEVAEPLMMLYNFAAGFDDTDLYYNKLRKYVSNYGGNADAVFARAKTMQYIASEEANEDAICADDWAQIVEAFRVQYDAFCTKAVSFTDYILKPLIALHESKADPDVHYARIYEFFKNRGIVEEKRINDVFDEAGECGSASPIDPLVVEAGLTPDEWSKVIGEHRYKYKDFVVERKIREQM